MENCQRPSMHRWLGSMIGIGLLVSTMWFTAYVNELPAYDDLCALCASVQATEDIGLWGVLQKMQWERVFAFLILCLMMLYSFALIVERWLRYSVANKQSQGFLSSITAALQKNQVEEAISIASLYPESPIAIVVDASLMRARGGRATESYDLGPSMESRQRAIVFVTQQLKRGLWTLGALAWSLPLVSLFLCVSGVILCLKGFRAAEGTGIPSIAGGLAESLWPTALAMLATIPIVWSQEFFKSKLDDLLLETDRLSLAIVEEIVDRRRSILSKAPTSPKYATQQLDSRPTNALAIDNLPAFRHHSAP